MPLTEFEQNITCMHLFILNGFITAARDYAADIGEEQELSWIYDSLTSMIRQLDEQITKTPFGKQLNEY